MCAGTQTDGVQAQRWNTKERVEENYTRDEILELLLFSEFFASLSIIELAHLAM